MRCVLSSKIAVQPCMSYCCPTLHVMLVSSLARHVAVQPCMSCCCPTLHVMLLSNLACHVAVQPCTSCCCPTLHVMLLSNLACHVAVICLFLTVWEATEFDTTVARTLCACVKRVVEFVLHSDTREWSTCYSDRLNNFYCTLLECFYIFWRCRS